MSTNNTTNELITFVRCSQKTYDNILPKENNTVYFVLDTGKIYQGQYLVGQVNAGPVWEGDESEPGDDTEDDIAIIGYAKLDYMKLN